MQRLGRTSQLSQAFSSTRPVLTVRSNTVALRMGRPFMVEKVFSCQVNVKPLPGRTTNLFSVRVSLIKSFMRLANVVRPLDNF